MKHAGKPFKRILRKICSMSPKDRATYDPLSVAEELALRMIDTGLSDGRNSLPAINAIIDRVEGPVEKQGARVDGLHVKVYGAAAEKQPMSSEGDTPYGPDQREQAKARAEGRGSVLRAFDPLPGPVADRR